MRNDANIDILISLLKERAPDKVVRLYLNNGSEIDVIVDCLTYVTIGDDEDVPAIRFVVKENSKPITLTGADIKRCEYCQSES